MAEHTPDTAVTDNATAATPLPTDGSDSLQQLRKITLDGLWHSLGFRSLNSAHPDHLSRLFP